MTKRKGNYKAGPGRDSFKKKYGSDPVPFRLYLPVEQHAYLKARAAADSISVAEFLRRLIAQDMEHREGE